MFLKNLNSPRRTTAIIAQSPPCRNREENDRTFFTNYILTVKEGVASYGDEKTTDVAFSYEGERIVIFDLSRSCTFKVACDTMEQLRNGRIFSPKYESKMKRFPVQHVVVFANRFPPLFAFSADRLQVRVFVSHKTRRR